MTQKQIEKILEEWKAKLNLNHWLIEFDYKSPCTESYVDAESHYLLDYDKATIRLNPDWAVWDQKHTEQIVVHELLHLHFRDLTNTVDSLDAKLGQETRDIFNHRWNHEIEGVCERLALCFVP